MDLEHPDEPAEPAQPLEPAEPGDSESAEQGLEAGANGEAMAETEGASQSPDDRVEGSIASAEVSWRCKCCRGLYCFTIVLHARGREKVDRKTLETNSLRFGGCPLHQVPREACQAIMASNAPKKIKHKQKEMCRNTVRGTAAFLAHRTAACG